MTFDPDPNIYDDLVQHLMTCSPDESWDARGLLLQRAAASLKPDAVPLVERLTMTPEQMAGALGIGRNNAYKLLASRQIHFKQVGRLKLVPKWAVDLFLRTENKS